MTMTTPKLSAIGKPYGLRVWHREQLAKALIGLHRDVLGRLRAHALCTNLHHESADRRPNEHAETCSRETQEQQTMQELQKQSVGMMQLPTLRTGEQLIQGYLIKFNNGSWSRHDGGQLQCDSPWLVIATRRALQRFVNGTPEMILKQHQDDVLPDPDELNARIPVEEWPAGLDGKPQAPWSLQFVAYLLEVRDAIIATFSNSAKGTAVAVMELERCIHWKRALHGGQELYPLTRLADAPWKTAFGVRRRPDFPIISWHRFVDGQLRSVEPLSLGAELKDSVPF